MYKCKECGQEYDEKPDFCDCGNDEFEIINDNNSETIEKNQKSDFVQKVDHENTYTEQKSDKKEVKKIRAVVDPISLVFFIFCLVMSFIVLFFLWNPKENELKQIKSIENIQKNVPSIDKIWNSTPPQKCIEELNKTDEKIKVDIVINRPKLQEQKPVQAAKKTSSKTVVSNTIKKQTAAVTPKKQIEVKIVQPKQTQVLQSVTQPTEIVSNNASKKAMQSKKTTQVEIQELSNYKARLRNTIGQKIDFTQVVGDGSCVVSFRISDTGKLVNRSFSQQSTNITLNDAVYRAVMQTPTFNPPPSAYENELLRLVIKFYNGNFEITLN